MSAIYAAHAHDYRAKGYSPLPLPPRQKHDPPTGFTGYEGRMASGADIQTWIEDRSEDANIAIRLPDGVIGLDVDAYDGKVGLATMLEATEQWGQLPKTWVSTSRPETVSGIRFYKVPTGRLWPNTLGPDVEVIRFAHRYAVTAPSIHPEGMTYVWLSPNGSECDPPSVDELPRLPAAWVNGLDRGPVSGRPVKADVNSSEVRAWLDALPSGQPCRYVKRLLAECEDELSKGSRHDTVMPYVGRMVRAGDQGHRGVVAGLDSMHSLFLAALESGKVREADRGEWGRLVSGAVALCVEDPTSPFDQGCCPDAPEVTQVTSQTDDQVEAVLDAAAAFSRDVSNEAYKLKVRDAAARQRALERAGAVQRPAFINLDEFLGIDDEPTHYRVDRMWPTGGRIVLAAQYKTGKSTLVGNVIRALADGEPLLGQFTTEPATVALIDNELDQGTLRRWLRDHGIANEPAVRLVSLRGKLSTFDILDPETRAEWAKDIAGVDVVILDCLRPALDALGLSEDKDAGKFLVAFDELLGLAGVREAAVVHHMGHTGERSRGDSRILDWPDATWKLVRENTDDPSSPRYLSAFGRDVDVAEAKLGFEPETRHLHVSGGNRRDAAADKVIEPLLELLDANPDGLSKNKVEVPLVDAGYSRASVRAAVSRLIAEGRISQHEGPRKAKILRHFASSPDLAATSPARSEGEFASSPLRANGEHPTEVSEENHFADAARLDLGFAQILEEHTNRGQQPGHCRECAQHISTEGHVSSCSKAVAP